jgi:hypothetical protein
VIRIRLIPAAGELPSPPDATLYLAISAPKAGLGSSGYDQKVPLKELQNALCNSPFYDIPVNFENPPTRATNPLGAKYVRIALECGANDEVSTPHVIRRAASYVWRMYTQTNHGEFRLDKMQDHHPKDALLYIDTSELNDYAEDFEGIHVFVHESVYDHLHDQNVDPAQLHTYSTIAYEVLRAVLDKCLSGVTKGDAHHPLALRIANAVSGDRQKAEELLDSYYADPYCLLALLQARTNVLSSTMTLFEMPQADDEEYYS